MKHSKMSKESENIFYRWALLLAFSILLVPSARQNFFPHSDGLLFNRRAPL